MGFKNKRTLNEFTNLGNMFFYYKDNSDKISILFYGNFPKNDTMMFVNNLNREYLIQTNQISITEDLSTESNLIEKEEVKTFKITTNMKNKSVIQSIMDNSFLGFHSKQEVDNFKNKGEIILNKSSNNTYEIVFMGDYDNKEAEEFVKNIHDEYLNKLQEITYERVLEKIKEKNFLLESELVDNNDSIVLTLNVN